MTEKEKDNFVEEVTSMKHPVIGEIVVAQILFFMNLQKMMQEIEDSMYLRSAIRGKF